MISADQCKTMWIDFDSTQTFSQSLSTRQEIWFKEENEMMDFFVENLACIRPNVRSVE